MGATISKFNDSDRAMVAGMDQCKAMSGISLGVDLTGAKALSDAPKSIVAVAGLRFGTCLRERQGAPNSPDPVQGTLRNQLEKTASGARSLTIPQPPSVAWLIMGCFKNGLAKWTGGGRS